MASAGSGGRKRWTERREMKEPTLYDEWKKEEAAEKRRTRYANTAAHLAHSSPGSTIRAVTPDAGDNAADLDSSLDNDSSPTFPPRAASSFDPVVPHSTGPLVDTPPERALSPKPRKLVKDRTIRTPSHASSSSRNGSGVGLILGRITSQNNGQRLLEATDPTDPPKPSRSRARTYEDARGDRSPTDLRSHSRTRTSSMNIPPPPSSGAEYLASVPAETSPPSAPSIRSIGSGGYSTLDSADRRSTSPDSSHAGDSKASSHSKESARRIRHLMKTLNGRYSGNLLFRRSALTPWTPLYCSVDDDNGNLIYEPRTGNGAAQTLVSGLKGCKVRPNVDANVPILELTLPPSDTVVHLKLLTQLDFDSWYATLLHWSSLDRAATMGLDERPTSSSSALEAQGAPEPPPRTSSAMKSRHRKDSTKSERRKSTFNPKEAPVIKIGRMIYWDISGHVSTTSALTGAGRSRRPSAQRMLSDGARRWRRINGQLRENGELKLSTETDNDLISVVQLSQLSRCAIQRLDSSVMDDEYCLAVYPQYTATPSDSQPGFVRPIFLGLENRVIYEVWFVLLRAFTIPQLYGPRDPSANGLDSHDTESSQDLDNVLATKTTDMFRMERSVSIRIIEAKMYPPNIASLNTEQISGRNANATNSKIEQHGHYAEVRLDNETRGKTIVKFDGPNALWGETFDFLDLPPVLNSASVVIKRRPPDAHAREQYDVKSVHEMSAPTGDAHGGSNRFAFDVVCGKVEIYLQELDGDKEMEKWWPVLNSYQHRVGEVLIKARADEGVILMARDYEQLGKVLMRFSNNITLQIAHLVPGELKKVSDCLLDIFQVAGQASEWLMSLVEEEIDGIHKETPISRLRFDRRVGSDPLYENAGSGSPIVNRENVVRDMNKTATLEANLLFRGNTLLTKSLDTHMRRVGKEYLEASLGAKLREINAKDPDCEVDPSRVNSPHELDRNWRRLLLFTQEVWKSILAAKAQCPLELRLIFRHIRACAEDRYGDFLRSVSYSSVSGFLFLRFFCPAVLNPKLFGLLKEDVRPRARRAFTLIAKSLQTLSNMASFGSKETWMEPMNAFLTQHRSGFKALIDDVCYVPTPIATGMSSHATPSSHATHPDIVSAESHLSYTTPTTIMARLPPTSREGFPSLPFLIDQPRAYAELVQLWLEATHTHSDGRERLAHGKSAEEISSAITAGGPDLEVFHEVCTALHRRTQDCLNRAERAERPNSASSFRWDELIDQLQTGGNGKAGGAGDAILTKVSVDSLAEKIGADEPKTTPLRSREWDVISGEMDHQSLPLRTLSGTERPISTGVMSGLHEGLRRAQLQSQGSDSASASMSNVSSAPSSDTENTIAPTALPSYEKEVRHRERREAAKQQIKDQVAAARVREEEKDKRKTRTPIVSALRKKNQRGTRGTSGMIAATAAGGLGGY